MYQTLHPNCPFNIKACLKQYPIPLLCKQPCLITCVTAPSITISCIICSSLENTKAKVFCSEMAIFCDYYLSKTLDNNSSFIKNNDE